MQVIHWGILMLLVLVVPFLLGMLPVRHMSKLQQTPAMSYICGWFVSFSVFELVAVPFIILEQRFTLVVAVYTAVLALLLGLSVWKGRHVLSGFRDQLQNFARLSIPAKAGWIVVLMMIGAQMAAAVFLEYYDGDDAYYIAEAVTVDAFDSMYLRDNYTGYLYPLDVRHALSPVPVYLAWLSRLSGIHAAVIAHSVLSVVWLMLMYCIYAQIGKRLLWNRRTYRPVFLFFVTLWYAFGNISLYTAETFIMTRTWQGKGLMAGIVLPALFLCLIYLAQEITNRGMWMMFICVNVSAVFATSVSFMLVPTVVGAASVLIGIKNRSIGCMIKVFACCIPCLLLAGVYIAIK